MDGITIPYMPAGLWIFASALTLIVLIVVFGFYAYSRRRFIASVGDAQDVASLSAKKQLLQEEVEAIRQWIEDQEAELERLHGEREQQEIVRAELSKLEQECATKDQENQSLRQEVGELENQRHLLTLANEALERDQKSIKAEIEAYEAQREEIKSLENRIAELRRQEDEANDLVKGIGENKVKLETLIAEKVALERQLDELKNAEQIALAKTGEAQAALDDIKVQIDSLRRSAEHQSDLVDDLSNEKEALAVKITRLESQLGYLEGKRNDLEEEKAALDHRLEELKSAEQTALEQTNQAQASLDDIKFEIESLRRSAEHQSNLVDELSNEKEALAVKLTKLESQLEHLEEKKNDLEYVDTELQKKNQKLEQMRESYQEANSYLQSVRTEKSQLDLSVSELQAREQVLRQEIQKLEGNIGGGETSVGDPLKAYSDLLAKSPDCLTEDSFSISSGRSEDEALQEVAMSLREKGLKFSSRVLDAFHTCLKCQDINPLTVLAGVSGTGKTMLPMLYSNLMGMHSLVMAVQPRWDSPQDMFGFYNYLEKEYKATELSRAMVRMDPYNYPRADFPELNSEWTRDRMLLVLLDEMNLARTEYYFSEFLSKLELRRLVNNPNNPADRSRAEIELDAGPGKDARFRLWVEQNVLFVGTMNEDETTQTLSDKVLDRANVLRFGKPSERASAENGNGKASSTEYLSYSQWREWIRPIPQQAPWLEAIQTWTDKTNEALNMIGRPFGFRVQQAIESYVANYPKVDIGDRYKIAFADQIEQKILPKLRGIDVHENAANMCLEDLEAVIAETGDAELGDAFRSSKEESMSVGMFQWRGVSRDNA